MTQPLPPDALTLVADIGGTNTRIAMARGGVVMAGTVRRFVNDAHSGPQAVLRAYLADHPGLAPTPAFEGAAVAIAGTVLDGRADMTNLGWSLSEAELATLTGARQVRLLNDLQAQGHALDHLAPGSVRQVLAGRKAGAQAPRLVIGLGTGFNACAVFYSNGAPFVPASEAGHCQLALTGEEARALALSPAAAPLRIEELLSGPGLARIHARLAPQSAAPSPAEISRTVETDPDAQAAMALFVRLLGRVCADLALTYLPLGGIFLVGGVSRAIAPFLAPMDFGASFHVRADILPMIKDFPVVLVDDDYAALTGCARVLLT